MQAPLRLVALLASLPLGLLVGGAFAPVPQGLDESSSQGGAGEPIVLGTLHEIESAVLGETRRVRVALPESYDETTKRCAVLYLLDGESLFVQAVGAVRHVSEEDVLPMIVVGIDNTNRTRDLTPPAGDEQLASFPSGGGSAEFRRFLVDELRPFIDRTYRTGGVRVLAGHSFGGLFTVEALLREPEAFTGFLALSPSLWWNDSAFVDEFEALPFEHAMFKRFAWFSMGDEDGLMNGPYERVTWALVRRGPADFRWNRRLFPGEDHWGAALPALGAGLKEFYAPIHEMEEGATTFEELMANARAASGQFGAPIVPGRGQVSSASYALALRGQTDEAIALMDDAIAWRSDEPYFAYFKARLLNDAGRAVEALSVLEVAITRFADDPEHEQDLFWLREELTRTEGLVAGD